MTMTSVNAFKVIAANFHIKRRQFYHIRQKWTETMPMPDYFEKLKSQDYIVAYADWPAEFPMPEVVLIMSPLQLKHYRTFGDAVSFDITYKTCNLSIEIIGNDGRPTIKHWNLGVFSCFIEDRRPVICGIAFMLRETIDNFQLLFKLLLKATGRFPASIITDQQASIITALNEIGEGEEEVEFPRFAHLLDQFHILQNVSKHAGKDYGKEARRLLWKMMTTRHL